MKKRILVFPCGSEVALDIHSSVKYSTYFHLVGASSVADHGKFVYEDYIEGLPYITDASFIPAIKALVAEHDIDAIYPAMDSVITMLKEAEKELDCPVISSSLDTVRLCLSKRDTYKALEGHVRIPHLYTRETVDAYPVFLKPNVGYGAKGAKRVDNVRELRTHTDGKDDLLICEYLPGEEFTVDCFTDRHGNLLYCAARKRNRIRDGISVNTYFVDNQEEFREMAVAINARVEFRGAWFYQVKRDKDGQLCLMEIASRLGGSSLLSRGIGVNCALLTLFDFFDYDVQVLTNDYRIELDRALENKYKVDISYSAVYVDYDDCLVLDKARVNVDLLAFLYDCLNKGKRIILLTKHKGDLREELRRFRIESLFDEIIHISPDRRKCDYITCADAIFIDDSHAERSDVKKYAKLHVFSPDMVEVLM